MGNKVPAVLIFGPPGSGKGTVSAKLKQVTNLYHLSTGDIFRGLSPESANGKLFFQYSNAGKLVPDEVTLQIFGGYVEGLMNTNMFDPAKQILLLDGIPRTPEQARLLKDRVDVKHIIQLDIPNEQTIIDRILGRAAVEGRKDDGDVEIIRNRINEYKTKTAAVLDEYPAEIVSTIDGEMQPLEVFAAVLNDWVNYLKSNEG